MILEAALKSAVSGSAGSAGSGTKNQPLPHPLYKGRAYFIENDDPFGTGKGKQIRIKSNSLVMDQRKI